jgi:hypothetical protein
MDALLLSSRYPKGRAILAKRLSRIMGFASNSLDTQPNPRAENQRPKSRNPCSFPLPVNSCKATKSDEYHHIPTHPPAKSKPHIGPFCQDLKYQNERDLPQTSFLRLRLPSVACLSTQWGGVLGVPSLGIYSLFYAYTRGAASIYSYL